MTTIKATCENCGDVSLTPYDLAIEIRGEHVYYQFYCPVCETHNEKPASDRVHGVLVAAGVRNVEELFAMELDQSPFIPLEWWKP